MSFLLRNIVHGGRVVAEATFLASQDVYPVCCRHLSRLRTKHKRHPDGFWFQSLTPPVLSREEAERRLEESPETRFQKIAPPLTNQTSSVFYDPLLSKFTTMVMMGGHRELADHIMSQVFERIKRTQLEKYHSAPEEDKYKIQLNPWKIFRGAVENCKPVLALTPLKRGGVTYQVPVAITDKRAEWTAMKWIILAARDKGAKERIWLSLAQEILNAYNNEGRVVKRKHDLHKQCEANKAYAHYRWSR